MEWVVQKTRKSIDNLIMSASAFHLQPFPCSYALAVFSIVGTLHLQPISLQQRPQNNIMPFHLLCYVRDSFHQGRQQENYVTNHHGNSRHSSWHPAFYGTSITLHSRSGGKIISNSSSLVFLAFELKDYYVSHHFAPDFFSPGLKLPPGLMSHSTRERTASTTALIDK